MKSRIVSKSKLVFLIFSFLCILAIGICFICNIAISKRITWAVYPFMSILFAWIIISPLLLVKKNKLLWSLSACSIAVFPYLYFMQFVTPVHNWFWPIAFPSSIMGIAALWISLILWGILKNKKWYLSASLVFLYGAIVNTTFNYFVNKFTGEQFMGISEVIVLLTSIMIAALLAIIGYGTSKDKNENYVL